MKCCYPDYVLYIDIHTFTKIHFPIAPQCRLTRRWSGLLCWFFLNNVLHTHQHHAAQAWIEGVLVCEIMVLWYGEAFQTLIYDILEQLTVLKLGRHLVPWSHKWCSQGRERRNFGFIVLLIVYCLRKRMYAGLLSWLPGSWVSLPESRPGRNPQDWHKYPCSKS